MIHYIFNSKKAALQVCGHRRASKASLSVEAAAVFCLFMIAMAILIMPFDMMHTNRRIRGIAESVCKDASQYAYTLKRIGDGHPWEEPDTEAKREMIHEGRMGKIAGIAGGAGLGTYVCSRVEREIGDRHIVHLSGLLSKFMEDGETIQVRIDYEYRLPIDILGIHAIRQRVVATRRAWIGTDGGKGEGEEDNSQDPMVYVGKTSTRYHLSSHCHYLHNDLQAVSMGEIVAKRNQSGGRYLPCERCGSAAGEIVYIMPSGSRYHSSADCSAIQAYVRTVRRSEVEYMGACSYCGGSHE